MPYDYHIGVDFHKAYSHIAVQDSSGKTVRSSGSLATAGAAASMKAQRSHLLPA